MSFLDLVKDLDNAGVTAPMIERAIGAGRDLPMTGDPTQAAPQHVVRVKVNANATGGGKYYGWIISSEDDGQLAETGNLAESDLGTIPTDTTKYVLILNAAEVGQSTHDLTAGSPVAKVFIGYLLPRRSTTDKLVVVISGYDWLACS